MESQSPKLSLDLSPPWLLSQPKKEPDKSSDYIPRLEDELRKIEAFKRELPLSVLLLTDAIQRLKEHAVCSGKDEIIPTTVNDKDGDKKSWMSSAQLWSSDQTLSLQLTSNKPDDGQACKSTEKVGALLSDKDCPERRSPVADEVDNNKLTRRGLFPVTSESAVDSMKKEVPQGGRCGRPSSVSALVDQLKLRYQSSPVQLPALQGPRKQRRCWSSELHRRFIEVLGRLGGPQVATPKQIRDLMQVDGLTNDEVKSHLQKYRLHIRKQPNSMKSSSKVKPIGVQDSQVECSGGSSSGGAVAALKAESTHSGSQQGPLQLAIGSAKCSSLVATKCDSMEDDYEDASDSHSWEGD